MSDGDGMWSRSAATPGRSVVAHEHVGVYGAWLQDDRLVTVVKSRGPYTGWFDLPGGSPE